MINPPPAIPYEDYYSLPWEYGAEKYGEVDRKYKYNSYSEEIYDLYWKFITQ